MQRRKEFLIGSLIGLSVTLLALLAIVVWPRPQAARAQSNPRVVISVGDSTLIQGQKTYVHAAFHDLPKDPGDDGEFGDISFRYHFDRNSDGSWTDADSCLESLVGGYRYMPDTWWRSPWEHSNTNVALTTTCQVGNYRLRVNVKDNISNTIIVTATHDITVSLGPSVTIDMPSGPHYRGTSINPTINFNNLVQGADYTYQAYLMARNPRNYAEICEGTGLERNNTFTITGATGNPIQKTVTVTDNCPTNEYTLDVYLKDSDDRKRGENSADFEITTDPNATPSVSVSMTESSPVPPGTEFDVIFNFYDIQPGTVIMSLDTMTDRSTNQPVGSMDCGGSLVGWGQDSQGSVHHNPRVNRITIPSDCPAGNYRIVSEIEDRSGNDIISGSIDFIIGDPDLTPTAPSVPGYTAKQNSPFNQQLPAGSGGDGTLTYEATPLPAGLTFNKSTRTIAGTPTGTGTTSVRYTVTDSDGDSDYVDFNITVAPDLKPAAPSIPGYTAKQNSPFTQQLPEGSGGDAPLSYDATPLPAGLSFITTTRTIEGTPTGIGATSVRYTITDSDGDSAHVNFNITVAPDLEPTAPSISGYTAKQNAPFSQQLPEGSGGDAPLSYEATPLPVGLSFITTTRTIEGTPTGIGTTTVRYTVTDSDGDSAHVNFNITVASDLEPTAPSISGYTAKQNSPFTQQLPEGSGGDAPLSYDATPLPAGLSFITTTRTIEGTPSGIGTTTVRYTVTDSDGDSANVEFNITVNADQTPTVQSISGYTAKQNSPFSQQLPAGTGGDAPLSYDTTPLPTGLSFITTTRTIEGTPTTSGSTMVRYTVTDSDGDWAFADFSITVDPDLRPTAPSIDDYTAKQNSSFTQQLPEGSDGDAPLTYAATGLPDGLSFITTTRTITGTPTGSGQSTVQYTVTDSDGDSDSVDFKITVAADRMPTLGTISDTHAKLTKLFTLQLPAGSDGDGVLGYDATGLPPGLSFITSTRTITGTPTTANNYQVTYTATDEDGDAASKKFSIDVFELPSLVVVNDIMAPKDEVFTLELTAVSGGRAPFDYDATPLPTGLTFVEASLTITGTPTLIQEVDVTFSVVDADGDTASRQFKISVSEGDTNPTFPSEIPDYDLRVGSPFAVTLPSATGGNAPYTYTISGHPDTLTFTTETRRLAGTPSAGQTGPHEVTYTATDRDGDPVSQTFNLDIAADNQPTEPSIGDMHFKVGYLMWTKLPSGTGGDPPYTYTITTLPSGMIFDRNTRVLSGRPDAAGATTVTYTVIDEDNDSAAKAFTINVYALPNLTNIADTSGMKNELFTLQLPAASGGRPPLSYSVTGLPDGLDFIASTLVITGTPSQVEVGNVTYTVTDNDNDQDSVTFKITVTDLEESLDPNDGNNQQNPQVLTLFDSTGFSATVGEQFTQQLPAANGGTPPYRYSTSTLPDGLTFNSATHTISGRPTTEGEMVVTYTVTDDNSGSVSDDFTITVNTAQSNQPGNTENGGTNPQGTQPLTVVDVTGYTATVGELFTQQLPFASGGTLPYSYRVTDLPDGLNFIMLRRTITGTPTITGTTVITYTVTDSNRNSASDAFTITVQSAGNNQGNNNQGNNNQGNNNQGNNNQGGNNQGSNNQGNNNQGRSNQGGNNQGNNNQGKNNQGGGNQGNKNQGSKSNSGNQGNANNQPKYVPPSTYSPPSQQYWSPGHNPVAITLPQWLNIRRGPGEDYEIITAVPEGTRGNIYGRDPADHWFQLRFNEIQDLAWVCQYLTRVEGSLDSVRLLEKWEIDLIPKPSDGPLAVTTPAILNVRAGPGISYEILTTVPKGTEATIIGIGPNAQWYMVTVDALNRPAWIYASLTSVTGFLGGVKQYTLAEVNGYTFTETDATDTCGANPIAITVPAILNVRKGPGTEYEIMTTVAKGTRAEIVGIDPQDEWLLVKLDSLVDPAWIYRDLTTVVGSLAGVKRVNSGQANQPNSGTNVDRPVAVTYPSLVNIRVGPGLTYAVLKAVRQGTRAHIIGLSPDENWYLVEIDGMSQLGWIREDLTVLVGTLHNVKRITAGELAMLPVAIVDTPILNVRSGPGTGFGLVTTISEGTWAQIVGVNPQTDWFRIRLDGVSGQTWVYRDLTDLAGLLAGVTQISASTVSAAADEDPALQATEILEAASRVGAAPAQQIEVSSITVEILLPSDGTIELDVSWTDAGACTDLYNLYYRSNADSSTYFSLETAVVAYTASTKSLSFLTLPAGSLISAWCGLQSAGRQVAEVQIDPTVEGTYSSLPSQPEVDAVAGSQLFDQSN